MMHGFSRWRTFEFSNGFFAGKNIFEQLPEKFIFKSLNNAQQLRKHFVYIKLGSCKEIR